MEPIRPDRSREWRNRRKSAGDTSAASSTGLFSQRLTESAPSAGQDDSIPEVHTISFADIPGVDAPTERLFDAIHEAGQRLLRERTYTAVLHYRETVRRFLQNVLPEANQVLVQESRHDILNRKQYFLLTEVNRSVDRLVHGLQQSQGEQLDILRRLEQIEGLLIDLVQ
jgi:uncharacterized protein YaaR (DUF327 family)